MSSVVVQVVGFSVMICVCVLRYMVILCVHNVWNIVLVLNTIWTTAQNARAHYLYDTLSILLIDRRHSLVQKNNAEGEPWMEQRKNLNYSAHRLAQSLIPRTAALTEGSVAIVVQFR